MFLFVVTNLAILVVLGFVMSLLGVNSQSTLGALVIAAIFVMGGSFISLKSTEFWKVLGGMKITHYEEENGFVEASVNDAREKQKIHVSE